jgi:putative transposase
MAAAIRGPDLSAEVGPLHGGLRFDLYGSWIWPGPRLKPRTTECEVGSSRPASVDKGNIMPYWRLYYHFVWSTKDRLPLLTPDIENRTYSVIANKCKALGGWVHAINGMPDHVHVVLAAPPRISPAEIARNLKGISAHFIQSELNVTLKWQRGYGVFSLTRRGLEPAVDYVRQQKKHHAEGTIYTSLEITTDDDNPPRH